MTSTYATLPVTRATFHEIERKLRKAGYASHFETGDEGVELIDMEGLALIMEDDGEKKQSDRSGPS